MIFPNFETNFNTYYYYLDNDSAKNMGQIEDERPRVLASIKF